MGMLWGREHQQGVQQAGGRTRLTTKMNIYKQARPGGGGAPLSPHPLSPQTTST
jgi:hypothetical protein